MDELEIARLVAEPESEWLERKAELPKKDDSKIRQTICSFSNDLSNRGKPSYLLIGVRDDGQLSGIQVDDALLLRLSSFRLDGNIQPLPSLTVARAEHKGQQLAIVTVWPADSPPVRCDGTAWVRVGPMLAKANPQEERRLTERKTASSLPYDQRPHLGATLADLDEAAFVTEYLPRAVSADVIRENHRPVEQQLASLRLYDLLRQVPTHAGILGFGKTPTDFLPGAFVQFTRYGGHDRTAQVLDHKDIKGPLHMQLQKLEALLPVQIQTPRMLAGSLRHEDRPDYPLAALREFVMNALMHRTYEATNTPIRLRWFTDRVEVYSPGGLFGRVTKENYLRESDYRNPGVAELLKTLGAVERFGSGITRAQAALQNNGNPAAVFEFEADSVNVIIHRVPRILQSAAKNLLHPVSSPASLEPGVPSAVSPAGDEADLPDEDTATPARPGAGL